MKTTYSTNDGEFGAAKVPLNKAGMKIGLIIGKACRLTSTLLLAGMLLPSAVTSQAQSGNTNCVPPPPDLVAWWRADGNTLDSAGGNLALPGPGVGFTNGMAGQAFSFDGLYGRLYVSNSPSLNISSNQNFTIEAWLRPLPSMGTNSVILDKRVRPDSPTSVGYLFALHNGQLYCRLADSTGNPGTVFGPAGPDLRDGNFHHVAVTARRGPFYGNGRLFVDGQMVLNLDLTTEVADLSNTEPLIIGASSDPAESAFFKGEIDELSLYRRELSTNDIYAIYAAGSGGKCVPFNVPPMITAQPVSRTVGPGSVAVFWVGASGDEPITYQWRFNGTNMPGATDSLLIVSNAQPANAGAYSVRVSNAFGWVLSADALLTVSGDPPLVIYQEHSPTVYPTCSNNAFFWVMAEGTAPLYFQWFKDGAGIPGATDYFYSIPNPQLSDSGIYYVLVTNAYGAGSSTNMVLMVTNQAPDIITCPLSTTVSAGTTTYLSVYAIGSCDLSYQWSKDGVGILGGTNSVYSIFNAQFSDAGNYSVLVSNAFGSVFCTNVLVTVLAQPPVITAQPQNVTAYEGTNVLFRVIATGAPPPSYQWFKNGAHILGATNSTYMLLNVQTNNSGSYSVLVSNLYGMVFSSNAVLTVLPLPVCAPVPAGIISWWRAEFNLMDSVDGNAALPLGAGFSPGKTGYGFNLNGYTAYAKVPNSPSLNPRNQLSIEFWMKAQPSLTASNRQGLVTTDFYGLETINYPFASTVGLNFFISTNCGGSYAQTLDVSSLGFPVSIGEWHHVAGTYDGNVLQLYVDGQLAGSPINCPGMISPMLTNSFLAIGSEDGRTTCPSCVGSRYFKGLLDEVSIYNRALSPAEILAIYNADAAGKCRVRPFIVTQPASQLVTERSIATFAVTAGGTPNLRYQWRFNTLNIPGATNASLTLFNVQSNNAGAYSVLVSNAFGGVLSSNALLTVNRMPVARCTNVLAVAGSNCLAGASINNGSFDPDGDPITLTQMPLGPYPLGTNLVFLIAADNKGASNVCTALVIVQDLTPPLIACPADMVVTNAHDSWTSTVTFSPGVSDNCPGTDVVCNPPSGSAFGIGTHIVTCLALDAAGNSSQAAFTVTVLPGNQAPVPAIAVSPLALFATYTNLIVIAPDNTNATVFLDGSGSFDLDDTSFNYFWSEGANLFSTAVVANTVLPLGTHHIKLLLDDTFPLGTNSSSVTVEVISPAQAVGIIMEMVADSALSADTQESLTASLNAAVNAFSLADFKPGIRMLQVFQIKVENQVAASDPGLADKLDSAAQTIIDAVGTLARDTRQR